MESGWKKTTGPKPPCKIRFYGIDIKHDDMLSGIKPILRDLRPTWNLDEVHTDRFSEGALNHMFCVFQKSDVSRDDAMVVRVHGINFLEGIDHRVKEIVSMQVAYAADCFPPVYAAFRNGTIYKYVPGKCMSSAECTDPDIIRQYAWKLYNLHHVDVNNVASVQRGEGDPPDGVPCKCEVEDILPGDAFVRGIMYFISLIPDKANDPARDIKLQKILKDFSREKLTEECEYVRGFLNELPLPMSLSHTDAHQLNTIFNTNTRELFFVDYEAFGTQIEYYDFAYLFSLLPFVDHSQLLDPNYVSLAEEFKHKYLICYRDSGYEHHGKIPSEIPEEQRERDLELLTVGHNLMDICMLFFHMTHKVGLVNLVEKYDLLQHFGPCSSAYYKRKEQLPVLGQKYKELAGKCW